MADTDRSDRAAATVPAPHARCGVQAGVQCPLRRRPAEGGTVGVTSRRHCASVQGAASATVCRCSRTPCPPPCRVGRGCPLCPGHGATTCPHLTVGRVSLAPPAAYLPSSLCPGHGGHPFAGKAVGEWGMQWQWQTVALAALYTLVKSAAAKAQAYPCRRGAGRWEWLDRGGGQG